MNRLKTQHEEDFQRKERGQGRATSVVDSSPSSRTQNQEQFLSLRCGWCHGQGQNPPSHHVLVVAARVGVPAVLEVVGQDVVPVVLLL